MISKNEAKESNKNYVIGNDLLNFGVDTININVELVDAKSVQDIDNYSFISYKQGNAKEEGFNRTITLKPKRLKEDKEYLKKFLNPNEISKIQGSSLSNLVKVIELLEKSPLVNKVNHIGRIDFAYDFSKDYVDTINLNKLLILCHNQEIYDNDDSYKDNNLRTEGYFASAPKEKYRFSKENGTLEICAYNKERQLKSPYNPIKTRLEYRFTQNDQSKRKSHQFVIKHQLRKLKKCFKRIEITSILLKSNC